MPTSPREAYAAPPAAIVPSVSTDLDTQMVAERLGRSHTWIRNNWQTLGGRKVRGRLAFPEAAIQQFIVTTTKTKKVTMTMTRSAPDRGPRAAAIYDRLEEGQSVSQIVRELAEPPEFVAEMRAEWRRGYELDREGLSFRCSCGAPSNPHTARCDVCAPRALVLSDAQLAALSDMPAPVPETCRCSGCGSTVGTHASRHLCARCQIGVGVQNGALVVTVGQSVIRQLTAGEARALFDALFPRRQDGHVVPEIAAPPAPDPDAEPDPAPVVSAFTEALSKMGATTDSESSAQKDPAQ